MTDQHHNDDHFYREDFQHFFEESLSGFVLSNSKGVITRCNTRLANWVGICPTAIKGKRIPDLLSIGSKIYFETHLWPLLRMQGFFDEVLVELTQASGKKLQVLINAMEHRDAQGNCQAIYCTITKAADRLQYEQNLQYARKLAEEALEAERKNVLLREQLIAVLGHDLRNPLGAILMATQLLETNLPMSDKLQMIATLKRSGYRMTEIIKNIMDFARTRMGEGIRIKTATVDLKPVLAQVVRELELVYPRRTITTNLDFPLPVSCDADRLAQLTSNLLANAITHGDANTPVLVHASFLKGLLKIEVCNSGDKITEDLHPRLFEPFKREGTLKSQNGLGLGLYIAAEIARAHHGTLNYTSTDEETCFTFLMDTNVTVAMPAAPDS